jgi:hypothetical protein
LPLNKEEPYIPEVPLIVFSHLRNAKNKTDCLKIQLLDDHNNIIKQDEFIFALGIKKEVSDHFELESNGYRFQFAVYSHRLHYQSV